MDGMAGDGWNYDPANAPTGEYLITDRMGRVSLAGRSPEGNWVHTESNAMLVGPGEPVAYRPVPTPARSPQA